MVCAAETGIQGQQTGMWGVGHLTGMWVVRQAAAHRCWHGNVGWPTWCVHAGSRCTAVASQHVGGSAPDRGGGVPRGHSEQGWVVDGK